MKDRFPGWYPRELALIGNVWDRAFFVPDANVLLHCLRHPARIREELLGLFRVLGDSLWIPYQVGLEFHRNRLDVEFGAQDTYGRLTNDLENVVNQAREKLKQLRAHPVINVESEIAFLESFFSDFKERMATGAEVHPKTEIEQAVVRLTELFDGRVGEKWTPEQLNTVRKEGEERYSRKIPPGFKDSKKEGDLNKYGDLIIWKDMIEKAKNEERPIVFITDDVKEDWWWLYRGRKLGPRPELVEEFQALAGQDFLIYEFSNFLRLAADRYQEIKEGVEEVEKSLLGDEQARRRQRDAIDARDISARIGDLEDERERIVAILSGTPSLEIDKSALDRPFLRSRLDDLNLEIEDLTASLAGDFSTRSAGET